jgi:hypothetical protein
MTLTEMAREAGREGQNWHRFTFREDVGALCENLPDNEMNAALVAWEEGNREHRIKTNGWVVYFTTAPEAYDTFGTETIETCGEWHGKELRKVMSHPHHTDYQRDRYCSGLHGSWDQDPRVQEAEGKARREAWAREDAARAEARRIALIALKGVSDEALIEMSDDPGNTLTSQDIRDERKRREAAAAIAIRESKWAAATKLVPIGATFLDNGTEGFRGIFGWIKGQDPHVYYSIRYDGEYTRDVEKTDIVGEGCVNRISLEYAAEWIQSGRLKIVQPGEVPPQKVTERIGHENVKKIQRHEVCGRVVWSGAKPFSYEVLILDENGRIVRAQKVIDKVRCEREPRPLATAEGVGSGVTR